MSALVVVNLRDAGPLEACSERLRGLGYGVLTAREDPAALELAHRERPAVVVLGTEFPELAALVRAHLGLAGRPSVLMLGDPAQLAEWLPLTAEPRVRLSRVDAGATELAALLRSLVQARTRALQPPETPFPASGGLFSGSSAAARRLLEKVARLAATPDSTLLVVGPRGAGHRHAVAALHARSPRAEGALVELPASFPGRDPESVLERAAGGTLFVPAVEDLGPEGQAALVDLLENRLWRPREGRFERELDARIVASSHGDLEARVEAGRFREDLFYRLNVLTLALPDLSERREDLPAMSEAVLAGLRVTLGLPRLRLDPGAVEALKSHPWPGQLEELAALLTRAALLSPGDSLGPAALAPTGAAGDPFQGKRSLREVEEALIRRVLDEQDNNRSRAARVLGVNRATLYNKLRAFERDELE